MRDPRFTASKLPLWAGIGTIGTLIAACSGDSVVGENVGDVEQAATICTTLRRTPLLPNGAADARVSSTTPTTNYGSDVAMGASATDKALVSFDLSSIPAGVSVIQAQLRLTETAAYTGNVAIHRATAPWVEGTVTDASFGSSYVTQPVTIKSNPAGTGVLAFAVTSVVSEWLAGTQPNYGFVVRQPVGNTDFVTSDSPTGSARPQLYICYSSPTCSDGVQNQGETGIDCGGPCPACASCSDGVQNQGETGVDCGGPCPACASCNDGVQNQGETGIDCGGPCGACPVLGRAPYVQNVTPSSAVLVWTTLAGSTSLVHYGTTPGNLNQTASLAPSVTQHEVTLTGLSADTRYYYDVGSQNGVLAGGSAAHYLTTAPVAGTKGKLRAWIVGDSGTGGSQQAAVRDAMLAYAGAYLPDIFLHMGDMAYNSGTTTEFTNNFFGMYAGILQNTVVWPTLGNHEGTNSDSGTQTGPYYTAYVTPTAGEAGGVPSGTEAYYSFDWANVHFVVLDSHDSPRNPGGAMLTWLQQDLASTTQDWLVAYWHHPAYTKGSHDSDTETQLVEMRQNALPILEAAGVDLVLAGHSHIYERSFLIDSAYNTPTTLAGHLVDGGDGKPLGNGPYVKQAGLTSHDGAVYVVAGHGGTSPSGAGNHPVMYFSEVQNGSCVLDVQDNRLSLVNVRYDGALTDRFTMVKGNALVLAQPDGGELLQPGTSYDIRWASVGASATVNLEYSVDDGQNYLPIATVPNTGSYTWTVPSTPSSTVLVRVKDAAAPSVQDESNAGFSISSTSLVTAISLGDVWKYDDSATDWGTAWLALGFDDSAWSSGNAQLGYGDGDEATVLFKANPTQPSYYFRKAINVSGTVLTANLGITHDDGFAVWVNGSLAASKYVNNGTSYAVFASSTSSENESTSVSLTPSLFVNGSNIVAVMVKQASASSSDVSFDASLTLTVGP